MKHDEPPHPQSDEDKVMAARKLPPDVRAARIAEIEAELALLRLPPYQEYPKKLPDGRTVESAAEEAAATKVTPDDAKKAKH